MREFTSCGVLCFYKDAFLLMKREHRYDLPKGHLHKGESEMAGALRQLQEETGIRPDQVELDRSFRYSVTYYPIYKRYPGEFIEKTSVIFVARLLAEVQIQLTEEHIGYEWVRWNPPHIIERETINGLMAAIEQHYGHQGTPMHWQFGG